MDDVGLSDDVGRNDAGRASEEQPTASEADVSSPS
jgi:hypothetical protein